MKIVSVVGGRPQFIKAAMVSRQIRKDHDEVIVHTGQHYDANMSDVFFDELKIPNPKHNLGIGSGTHAYMTGKMLIAIEEVLIDERPDAVIIYGDMNSTLAGALAAVKLHIPVFHVESGGRVGTLDNPEEVNRILSDRVSTLLFCSTESTVINLSKEGISKGVYFVGNPMYDAFLYYKESAKDLIASTPIMGIDGNPVQVPSEYYYLTCHRQENTEDDRTLIEILSAMEKLSSRVVFPVHPRIKDRVKKLKSEGAFGNTIMTEAVGYLLSIYLINNARRVITDSGGVQTEAFFAKVPCVTIFDRAVWPETMVGNANQLAQKNRDDILRKLSVDPIWDDEYSPFGDGHSAEKIHRIINEYFRA